MKETHPASVRSLLLSVLMLSSTAFQAQAYYHPEEGRWLSRDPQEEWGGMNLHSFWKGDPINYVDVDGRGGYPLQDGNEGHGGPAAGNAPPARPPHRSTCTKEEVNTRRQKGPVYQLQCGGCGGNGEL